MFISKLKGFFLLCLIVLGGRSLSRSVLPKSLPRLRMLLIATLIMLSKLLVSISRTQPGLG